MYSIIISRKCVCRRIYKCFVNCLEMLSFHKSFHARVHKRLGRTKNVRPALLYLFRDIVFSIHLAIPNIQMVSISHLYITWRAPLACFLGYGRDTQRNRAEHYLKRKRSLHRASFLGGSLSVSPADWFTASFSLNWQKFRFLVRLDTRCIS